MVSNQADSYDRFNAQPNFKPVNHLFELRLRQFTDEGKYKDLNLPKFYDIERHEIEGLQSWRVPDFDGKTLRPLFKDIEWDKVEFLNIGLGYNFGPSWKTHWVKFTIDIPESWLKHEIIEIDWDSSSEAFIYDKKGFPLQAFTGGGERNLFRIPKEYKKTGKQLFYIEVACNGMFGNGDGGHPDPNRYFRLNRAHLVLPNMEARRLYWDFWILGDAAREFPGNLWQKHQALDVCNSIMNVFDPNDIKTIAKGRELATKLLGDDVDSEEVFEKFSTSDKRIDVFAVGNCHIDTAWEWPFAETKRKIVRSWTTQLKIAEEYPEYIFVASQMQQFKWLKMYHPEIFAKVKEKFHTNQFIPVGGSWVENDTNLPNGESLIRQFLLGQRFQYDEFGFYSNIFWLPDTFGYSSQIPQICQLVGIPRFLTQKLSWNNINDFPLSTFNWVALDGSQVLVHMPPANTYTASAHFGDVVRSQLQHKNLNDVPTGLLLYGHGDGGGGPTEEMIEKIRRCRGLANKSGLMPNVHMGATVDDFYDDILAKSNQGRDLPTWVGEIYLEFHRGTYTTQANVKKLVRFGEIKLHDLEMIAGLVSVTDDTYKYPTQEIHDLWEDLCLCQFHDVIPGSCIGMVYYDEVLPMLTKNLATTYELIEAALSHGKKKETRKGSIEFVNTLPWERRDELVEISCKLNPELYEQLSEKDSVKDGEVYQISVNCGTDGCCEINKLDEIVYGASVIEKEDGSFVLGNELLKATISKTGILTSLYDVENDREVIDTQSTKQTNAKVIGGNQFVLFDDEPLNFPAWDTELYSLQKFKFLENGQVKILKNNKLESSVVVEHVISESLSISTVISIQGLTTKDNNLNNFVKFKCDVVWHETYKFLKVQFPTTVHTAGSGLYETQFGVTTRPTHFNTTWDVAKFEVAHHKFMDLSEYDYGVSIVNNCKYGAAIHGNLMRLSLLRSAKEPDDLADMGNHTFEYGLFPHKGGLSESTVRLGYNFNYRLEHAGTIGSEILLSGSPSLVLSHIKRGENDKDVNLLKSYESKGKSIVLRVYESLGAKSKGTLKFDDILKIDKVYKTNALEDEVHGEEVTAKNNKVNIELRAFEIATYKVFLK